MFYYNTVTKEYPRYAGDIQLDFPEFKDGDSLPETWVVVTQDIPPTTSIFQRLIINEPIFKNGKWTSTWTVLDLSNDEKTALINRQKEWASKPYESWVFDETTLKYVAPVSMPEDDSVTYYWDEENLSWKENTE